MKSGNLTSFAIRETQFKSTLRFHFTVVRVDVIKKTRTNAQEAGKDIRPLYLAGGSINSTSCN